MTRKKVWRYRCDFCGKGGCSAGHMRRHEEGCTKNPDRKCHVCEKVGEVQRPMAELVAVAMQIDPQHPEAGAAKLRDAANGCPVCMFAALRQSPGGLFMWPSFRLQEELAAFWREYNDEQAEREQMQQVGAA